MLSSKPVIYCANIAESDMGKEEENPYVQQVKAYAAKHNAGTIVVCAKTEEELSEMDEADREMFLADFGLKESGLDKLIKASYALLGLISYLTAGEKETPKRARKRRRRRARSTPTLKRGSSAPRSSNGRRFWSAAALRARAKRAKCAPRARTM